VGPAGCDSEQIPGRLQSTARSGPQRNDDVIVSVGRGPNLARTERAQAV
jgi:hypothetical protein